MVRAGMVCSVLLMFAVVLQAGAQGERHFYGHRAAQHAVRIYPQEEVVVHTEGEDVVLDCRDEGELRAQVEWTHAQIEVPSSEGRVALRSVQWAQAGRYACHVVGARRRRGVTSSSVVVVVEPRSGARCTATQARCGSGECVSRASFCDELGRYDCADRSDQRNCRSAPRRRLRPTGRRGVEFFSSGELDASCQVKQSWTRCNKRCRQYQHVNCGGVGEDYWQRRPCRRLEGHCAVIAMQIPYWLQWSEWSACSATCGNAVRQRTRQCSHPSVGCVGMPAEVEPCVDVPCPVDGDWSGWSEWTPCSPLGARTRERRCDQPPPLHNGSDCVGVYRETQECQVCSGTVQLKLSPGRVRCVVGRPTTFVCEFCSDEDDQELKIEMDTEPDSSEGTPAHENMHAQTEWSGTCTRRAWTVKLANEHERVACVLKNNEDTVVGRVTSTIRIVHGEVSRLYATCQRGQFTCSDKRCVDNRRTCDGHADCHDASDEHDCPDLDETPYPTRPPGRPGACGNDERYCPASKVCIPDTLSDGAWGGDWSLQCGAIVRGTSECLRDQFCCARGNCVARDAQCDGRNDCGDFSDEMGCRYLDAPRRLPSQTLSQVPVAQRARCHPEQVRCKTSQVCILKTQACDGVLDCADASDELHCPPPIALSNVNETRATTRTIVSGRVMYCREDEIACDEDRCVDWAMSWCDGHQDCIDGTDEVNCTAHAPGTACSPMQFECADVTQCVPLHVYCDGVGDCVDKSDEPKGCVKPTVARSCKPGQVKCAGVYACVDEARVCDDKPDCPHGTDEDACAVDLKTNEVLMADDPAVASVADIDADADVDAEADADADADAY